jgi:hypothetical protein
MRASHEGHVGCSPVAQALDEPLFGKAGGAVAWLLLEHPGPWGGDPFAGPALDQGVMAALRAAVGSLPVRLLAIRRYGRPGRAGGRPRTAFLAYGGLRGPFAERLEIAHERELLDVDYAGLAAGRRPGLGVDVTDPLLLVCTNGRKDACCAEFGRPLARALTHVHGERVWECSHVGGDRFAANLVCLPEGLYYGHVSAVAGLRIVAAYERGELELAHLRGRSGSPPLVQAADHLVRRETGLLGIDALRPVDVVPRGRGEAEVAFLGPGDRRLAARVRATSAGARRPTTCGSGEPADPGTYELLALVQDPPARRPAPAGVVG